MSKKSFFEAEPELYEKTFGYRDFKTQTNFLERIFKKNKARKVLDIASGHSPHGRILAKKGYKVSGIDLSESLLKLGRKRARNKNIKINFYKKDMINFYLGKFDVAYIMFNSILRLNSKNKLKSHFKSVNRNLRNKGVYVIDLSQFPFRDPFKKNKIDRKIKGIRSVLTYTPLNKKKLNAKLKIETYYEGKKYTEELNVLMFLPIEILKDIAKQTGFEIANIYSNFKFKKIKGSKSIKYIAILEKVK